MTEHSDRPAQPNASTTASHASSRQRVSLRVNGEDHALDVDPRETLLGVLRERLHLTGAKLGCGMGDCGACTVLLDEQEAVYSCLLLAVSCEGHAVTTVEGLAKDGELTEVQRAFITHDALQCGFCTPGQVLAMTALLRRDPHPSDDEIERAMAGNICRCGAYVKIREAAHALATRRTDAPAL